MHVSVGCFIAARQRNFTRPRRSTTFADNASEARVVNGRVVMPFLSEVAQKKKCEHFLAEIPKTAHILEIGCGSGWVGEYLRQGGWKNYVGMDIVPPADLVGDIKKWRDLKIKPGSFDFIVAFEVVEHVDLVDECFDLLKPGGKLLLTSPVPSRDWVMKLLEIVGLNQKRTSPHDNLVDFRTLSPFEMEDYRVVAGLSQWGILRKPAVAAVGV
jgi:SAM-dependent methyltransferase